MFRLLSRVLVALAALFALRVFFATARRVSRGGGAAPGPERDTNRAVGGKARRGTLAGGPGAPRIDRAAAEDVPFVEVEPEPSRRG